MATTRSALGEVSHHLEESLGVRNESNQPKLSPVPQTKDVGRRPSRNVGHVEIELVIPDPKQPRVDFSEEALERLAQSIRDKGQLSPIHVRWSSDFAKWIIISGERRWRATKRAGLSTIECHFHEKELPESEILEQQLIENLLREDLRPMEEARAYQKLTKMNNWNGKQLAETLRITPSKVTRGLALLKLPADIQSQIERGALSARTGYELSKLADERQQRELAASAIAGNLPLTNTAKTVRQRRGKPRPKRRGIKQTFVTDEGWRIVISIARNANYHEMEEALVQTLEEVRLRIINNVYLC